MEQETKTQVQVSDSKPNHTAHTLLLIISLALICERISAPHQPFGPDTMTYAVIAHEMKNGRSLYSDLWDHKPPAIYIVYMAAEFIVGYGPRMLLFLEAIIAILAMLGVYWAAKKSEGGKISGLWAAAFWALLSGSYRLEAREPNTEIFINTCMIYFFGFFTCADGRPLGMRRSVLLGALLTLGSFFKPVVVVSAALFALVHVLFCPQKRDQAFIDVLVMGIVGFVGWGALFGYFALTGRFGIFTDTLINYNRYYAGDPFSNIIAPLQGRGEVMPDSLNPLAILTAIGALLIFRRNRRLGASLMAFAVSAWIMIALPGQFFPHYYQLWLPPLVIGAGLYIGLLAKSCISFLKWSANILGVGLFVFILLTEIPFYQAASTGDWHRLSDLESRSTESTAREIDALLMPDETFFAWTRGAGLYFWSRRRPPVGVFYTHHLLSGPLTKQLSLRVAADLSRNHPELLVVSPGEEIPDWLANDYIPLQWGGRSEAFKFYARRGSRLESKFIQEVAPSKSLSGD
jgi:hypothetical protein